MSCLTKLGTAIGTVLLALTLTLSLEAQTRRGRGPTPEETSRPKLPVLQYSVAVVCGGIALWSVLRSSRRGWSK
jgi:hypothetical protein